MNLKKNIKNKILNDYQKITLIFNDYDQIIIDNYKAIFEIDDKKITVDKIIINGKDLKIVALDDYQIKINGKLIGIDSIEE